MKKLFALIINLALVFGFASSEFIANAENPLSTAQLEIGDYFIMGKYNDEPIVWRYVADDENGKLMVSDKILCYKPFGDYYSDEGRYISASLWKNSFIREWLNSTISVDKADWSSVIDEVDVQYHNMDMNEKGFLHEDNFSATERSALKTVTQWTMLSKYHLELSENGINTVYDPVKLHVTGSPKDGGTTEYYDVSELPEHYSGAAIQTADTIFLLDEMQVYSMWKNMGNIGAVWNKEFDYESYYPYYYYFLRTPIGTTVSCISGIMNPNNSNSSYTSSSISKKGIRPAFYLDENNAVILSGAGTDESPYIVDGKPDDNGGINEKPTGISVFFNGSEISFDQLPFIENDRVLVPMRAIFEAFGAEVKWDGDTEVVIAKDGSNTITMQIGNNIVFKNTEEIESDVVPRIVKDRTFVPLRVIAESLEAKVDWNKKLNRVDITK